MTPESFQPRVALFAGPSRPDIATTAPLDVLPPAVAGDIRAAFAAGYRDIVFADAMVLDVSPPHRELMQCLREGARIYGCSSTGALRAIELAAHGMRGVGYIHAAFRGAVLNDDGELAAGLDSETYHAVTVPLIQVRYYLGWLMCAGADRTALAEILRQAQRLPFAERYPELVMRACEAMLGPCEKDVWDPCFRIKSLDAALACNLALRGAGFHARTPSPRAHFAWLRNGASLHA